MRSALDDRTGPGPDDRSVPGTDDPRTDGPVADGPVADGAVPGGPRADVPEATVSRLPVYLRALRGLADRGIRTVSSEALARAAGVGSAKLRKDLSHLGSYGTRGVGYAVDELVRHIGQALGLGQRWPVVLVGVGNLGSALAGYGGFDERGFCMVGLLDSDPSRVGQRVGGLVVRPLDDLDAVVRENAASIGVIATPAEAAQEVCDRLVRAGITSVLNFAPTLLQVPEGVDVRKVDLSHELQILSFHEHRKAALVGSGAGPVLG